MVVLVASAASRSRSTLPVDTDWLVIRNVSTSVTDCADAGDAVHTTATASAAALRLVIFFLLVQFDPGRSNDAPQLDDAFAGYSDARLEIVALAFLELSRRVGHD